MKRSFLMFIAAAAIAGAGSLVAQSPAPEIPYDANADLLKFPDNIHLGEAAGVATNSKGHIFVYSRSGAAHATLGTSRTFYKAGSRLFQFDPSGKFVKEIGVGVYGLNFAQAVKVDPQDNIWVVDQGSSNVIKFDPEGRIQLVLGRKPEAIAVRVAAPEAGRGAGGRGAAGPPGSGIPGDSFTRTSDVAWDRAGNIYVADGVGTTNGNARIAKFDKAGHFIKSWGSRGSDPETLDNGEIYKLELDGRVVGKFGKAGRLPKEFGMVNSIDCRNENELLV